MSFLFADTPKHHLQSLWILLMIRLTLKTTKQKSMKRQWKLKTMRAQDMVLFMMGGLLCLTDIVMYLMELRLQMLTMVSSLFMSEALTSYSAVLQ